ncbi:MAG: TIGR03915 family putative DNA repair protein [Lachnospiraceae bacterium]|nr:TIGR03915 family putative DNA repair protein [Lachnospiraceae bacterium]
MITVFLCGPEPEDIFTAVYDAWASRLGHSNVRLEIESEEQQMGLFCQYRRVARDLEKAEKVGRSIARKISWEAYYGVYQAALSFEQDRADAIYRFLVEGFRVGADIIHRLQIPAVCRVFELSRKVGNESHLFLGFTRFVQWDNGVLFARVAPKCNVLPLLAPHFEDRMSGEHWMIYDENRHKAAVHPAGRSWFMVDTTDGGWEAQLRRGRDREIEPSECSLADDGANWEQLWRTFVTSIAIEPRRNPGLQRNLMPLWYRKHMTEHQTDAIEKATMSNPSEIIVEDGKREITV